MTDVQCHECGSYNTTVTKTVNNGNHGHPGPSEILVTDYDCHDCHGTGEVECAECGTLRGWRNEPCPECGNEEVR